MKSSLGRVCHPGTLKPVSLSLEFNMLVFFRYLLNFYSLRFVNNSYYLNNRNELFNEIFLKRLYMLIHFKEERRFYDPKSLWNPRLNKVFRFFTAVFPRTFHLSYRCIIFIINACLREWYTYSAYIGIYNLIYNFCRQHSKTYLIVLMMFFKADLFVCLFLSRIQLRISPCMWPSWPFRIN